MCMTTTGVQQKQCFRRGGGGSIVSPALTSQAVFTKTTFPDSEEREMCGAVQFQFQSQNNYAPRSWCFFWKPSLWAHYLKAMKIRDLCLLLVVIQWLSSNDTFWFFALIEMRPHDTLPPSQTARCVQDEDARKVKRTRQGVIDQRQPGFSFWLFVCASTCRCTQRHRKGVRLTP